MNTQSNLYIEKLIAEHPLACWMFNETLDYIPLNSEADRAIENSAKWTVTNGTAYSQESSPDFTPFPDSHTSRIERVFPFASTTVTANSLLNLSISNFKLDLQNICLSGYVYMNTTNILSISYGYKYYDTSNGLTITISNTETITEYQNSTWVFFSNTFNLPPASATNINPFFAFVSDGSVGTSSSDYSVLLNGVTFGQWSELFNSHSLGVYPSTISESISLPSDIKVIPAKQYGTLENDAYYLGSSKELYCKNFGIPLVYGSSNATDLYPGYFDEVLGIRYPSLILPGYGFLNERGKYNDYTIEMWIRLNADSSTPLRIFGPIASNDGLYVESGFLTLVIGNQFKPYHVGEWFRPMLIHIRYISGNVSVLLNGEEIISITLKESNLYFPKETIIEDDIEKSQDWLGFYTYDSIHPLTIDSVSIFSYSVPNEVAKRRWVWGQAVVPLGSTNASLNARTVVNDYTYSGYAVNHSYPDFANWKQGFSNNIDTSANVLKLPEYSLPTINLGTKKLDAWYKDLRIAQIDDDLKYFSFSPNAAWDQPSSYFYFDNLGFLSSRLECLYGVFESDGSADNEVLFKILNKANGDNLTISIFETTVTYEIVLNGISTTIHTETVTANKNFVIGFTLSKLSLLAYSNISKFFQNLSLLSLYVAGNNEKSFSGKIYKIGFDSFYNNKKINKIDNGGFLKISDSSTITNAIKKENKIIYTANHNFIIGDIVSITETTSSIPSEFNLSNKVITNVTDTTFSIIASPSGTYTSGGVAQVTQENRATGILSHTANYTLVPIDKFGLFFADIAISGYWQDYMPLTYFAKYVKNNLNELVYDLDFLQFNLDYPEPIETFQISTSGDITYQDLKDKFSIPYKKTYHYLDNSALTGWEDYDALRLALVEKSYYDTSKSSIKSFISFQNIVDGSNKTLTDFDNIIDAFSSSIVDPNTTTFNWEDSAYSVVDGSIIYPPLKNIEERAVDFNNIGLVYHLEFTINGINHNKIGLKKLQIASQVLNAVDFTPLGTKYGIDIYPYAKRGLYYNFKEKNPISTYKGSTPYLYLTRHSGWRLRGDFDLELDRGISIPINKEAIKDIKVNSIQVWCKYTEKTFPSGEVKFLSLVSKDTTYDFYFDADQTLERAKIFAKDRNTGIVQKQFLYYVNGNFTNNPYILREEWSSLSIAFGSLLDFNEYSGRLNLNGPLIYNNISYYLSSNLEQEQRIQTRSWVEVRESTWDYWQSTVPPADTLWNDVKIISVSQFALVDPSVGYAKYIGNDRIVVDDGIGGLLINPKQVIDSNDYDNIKVYGTTEWLNSTRIAV